MNEILAKNLEQIKRYNKELVKKIENFTELHNDIRLTQTLMNEPNITFNGTPVHSNVNAEEEAKKIFNSVSDNTDETIHLIFGLGLGYVFKEFCDSSKGTIVLFEPSVEILRAVLEMVDFSEELKRKDVYIVASYTELFKLSSTLFYWQSKLSFSFLPFYRKHYESVWNMMIKRIEIDFAKMNTTFNTIVSRTYSWFDYATKNLPSILKSKNLGDYKDVLKNKPAVIVSAGPSLSSVIDILKENQDNLVIFVVGTALKAVINAGIKPDFVVIVESGNTLATIKDVDIKNTNFILDPTVYPDFFTQGFENIFLSFSKYCDANAWLGRLLELDISEYETRGTVSYCALNSAKILGCNPLILVGQDLAFINDSCYAQNGSYSSLKCIKNIKTNRYEIVVDDIEHYRLSLFGENPEHLREGHLKFINNKLEIMNAGLMMVKGQNGKDVPTEAGYATFIEFFKEFALENQKNIRLINSSQGGAFIDGFEHIPLEKALNYCAKRPKNVNNILKSHNTDTEYDFDKIIEKLYSEYDHLERSYLEIKMDLIRVESIIEEFEYYNKKVTEELISLIKAIEDKFYIVMDYVAKQKYNLFEGLIVSEYVKINKMLRLKRSKYDNKTFEEKCKTFKECYTKIVDIIELKLPDFKKTIEEINETF